MASCHGVVQMNRMSLDRRASILGRRKYLKRRLALSNLNQRMTSVIISKIHPSRKYIPKTLMGLVMGLRIGQTPKRKKNVI